MRYLLLVLGIAGFAAVLRGAVSTSLRLVHGGVEVWLAGGLASLRANRGDITGLQDAAGARTLALAGRRAALGNLAFWIGLLLAPVLTPWPAAVFAGYSALWFLPRRRSDRA